MTSFLVPLSLPHVEAALRDAAQGSPEARWVAALALGSHTGTEDPRILSSLRTLCDDPLEEVRAQAIEGLHSHLLAGATVDSERLVRAMSDEAPRVRCAAVEAIATLEGTQDSVVAALRDPDADVRASAACALCGAPGLAVQDSLAEALNDPSPVVRLEAARGLAIGGDGRGLELLLLAAAQGDEREELVLEALGLLGDHRAQDCLRARATRFFGDPRTKALAAAALFRCHDASGQRLLEGQLQSRSHKSRMAAMAALCTLPIPGLSAVLGQILDTRDDEEASSAIVALAALAREVSDAAARRELLARHGQVRPSLADELEDTLRRLEER